MAYRGTQTYRFDLIFPVHKLKCRRVYSARCSLEDGFTEVTLRRMSSVSTEEYNTESCPSFKSTFVAWRRLTRPTWPIFGRDSSLGRLNCATWEACSNCMDLSLKDCSVLLVSQTTWPFMLLADSTPPNWSIVHLDSSLNADTVAQMESPKMARFDEVSVNDTDSIAETRFDYVILSMACLHLACRTTPSRIS